jgi:heme/copper-type cytochrome/quinol oxidase subunit 3
VDPRSATAYTITANTFWSFYYTAAGIHGLHVIAGHDHHVVVASRRRTSELHRVELIGLYWHFVDLVWIFLFPLLYIAKSTTAVDTPPKAKPTTDTGRRSHAERTPRT